MENTDAIFYGIKNGDQTAFDKLFAEYYEILCRYAVSIVNNHDNAEDIVQELFAKIWVERRKLSNVMLAKPYLFRSVYNASIDHLKRLKVRNTIQFEYEQHNLEIDKESIYSDDFMARLEKCIDELPDQCRKIFKLSRFENMKYREIADALHISENTVDTQIRRALNKLRIQLKDYLPTILFALLLTF